MTVNKKMVNKNIFFEFQNLEVYKSIIIQYSLQKITKKNRRNNKRNSSM